MRKTKLITAILSVTLLFSGAVALEETNQPQTVQAAAKKLGSVTVKGKKKFGFINQRGNIRSIMLHLRKSTLILLRSI